MAQTRLQTRAVHRSSPYDATSSVFASCRAAHASGQIAAVLSLANSCRSQRSFMSTLLIDFALMSNRQRRLFGKKEFARRTRTLERVRQANHLYLLPKSMCNPAKERTGTKSESEYRAARAKYNRSRPFSFSL